MRNANPLLLAVAVGSLTLSLAVVSRTTSAQGPGSGQNGQKQGRGQRGQRGGFPGGPGGQGQGQGFPGGRGGFGGPGGPGGMMPFASGTVTGGDLNAGTLTIQSPFGGGDQTIHVTNGTRVVTQAEVSASDLKVGDTVQVQGVPTGISASSLTAGDMPDFLPGGGGGFRPRGGFGGPGANGAANGGNAPANPVNAFASATGRISATRPLTITVGDGVALTVKLPNTARVTRYQTSNLSSIKVGDRVMASGQAGADGVFSATGLGVNMEMGRGMGPGGFGGIGGPGGGPGGPGGPPPGRQDGQNN